MKAASKETEEKWALTAWKLYDVLGVRVDRKSKKLKEIKVKNDRGQESWYGADKFIFFAEAEAYIKQQAAAGAGQNAAQPLLYNPYMGAEIARAADMTAGNMVQKSLEAGEELLRGLADGLKSAT